MNGMILGLYTFPNILFSDTKAQSVAFQTKEYCSTESQNEVNIEFRSPDS
jgi:hypothetical protein